MSCSRFRFCIAFSDGSTKDHGAIAVHEHAMLHVPLHRPRQYRALDVAAGAHAILEGGCMVDARHVLLDDRPLVERGGDVVRGGTDELHATAMRLVVRACALE